tara:strand:+ start:185 stop:418 length:234 start_codon:yes stop_codon:yes gene_type:complete
METCGIVRVDGVIDLPDYMVGHIDPETICVNVTPIGVYQNLFVESIQYGAKVIIRNASGGAINAYYHIHAKEKPVTS